MLPGIRPFAFLLLASYASADEATDIRRIVESGALTDLRWSNFHDYQSHALDFYEHNKFRPFWIEKGQPTNQARAVIDILGNAESKGLNSEDYDRSRWPARIKKPGDAARFDVALTISLMRYLSDLHLGRQNPGLYHADFDIDKERHDFCHIIRERLVGARDVKAVIDSFEPPFEQYRRTEQALQIYRKLAEHDGEHVLTVPRKSIEPGGAYEDTPLVARILKRAGDLAADAPDPERPNLYDKTLSEAVKKFQRRHGLEPDGKLGKGTIAQLSVPLSQRVRQLELSLERWRWVPHEYSRPPIIVNIPEFLLTAFTDSLGIGLEMRVVVGKAQAHETPVFSGDLRTVVFHPYWNVPPSIQAKELVPKIAKDRAYLGHNGYEVVNSRNEVVASGEVDDATLKKLRAGQLALRQTPGSGNALGPIKFLFPNDHNVYLHGTPAQALFSRSRRDFSHGCVRLEKPAVLAEWVLQDKPQWTPARIADAMRAAKTQEVALGNPIPVLIVYATAVVREDGEIRFFDDIYGLDEDLKEALATSAGRGPGQHVEN